MPDWGWGGGARLNGRSWDIIGRRRWGYALSLLIILPGVAALLLHGARGQGALNWGIDFTGGTLLQLRIERSFSVGQIREVGTPTEIQGSDDPVLRQFIHGEIEVHAT